MSLTPPTLEESLELIASLEENHSPYGVSLSVKGQEDISQPSLPPGMVKDYASAADSVARVIQRSAHLAKDIDNIPEPSASEISPIS